MWCWRNWAVRAARRRQRWTSLAGLLLAFLLLLPRAVPARAAEGDAAPTVMLDGLPLQFDVPPVIVAGRTLVPVRTVAEALGMQVIWDPDQRKVTATGLGRTAVLYIDRSDAYVDGHPVTLDVPATIMGGRTLVPLRFLTSAFGGGVVWNPETRTVWLTSPPRPLYLEAFYAIQAFDQRGRIPLFDRVDFGWSQLKEDGSVDLHGPDFYWPEPAGSVTPESILADAAKAGTERYLMVFATDGDGGLMRLLADDNRIEVAARHITDTVMARGFDGVTLDLEGLGWTGDRTVDPLAVQARFNKLVGRVAELLHMRDKGLAVALHPLNSAYKGYDYAYIGAKANEIVVMAYDYRSDRGPEPLAQVADAVKLALAAGVPADKLVLGINLYHEEGSSLGWKVGVAKRFGLKGAAFWRLGLLTDEHVAAMRGSVVLRR